MSHRPLRGSNEGFALFRVVARELADLRKTFGDAALFEMRRVEVHVSALEAAALPDLERNRPRHDVARGPLRSWVDVELSLERP